MSRGGVAEGYELRIHLLGGFRVAVRTRVIEETAWRLRKARSLIKVLALAPRHRLHREQVMDLLWPDQEPSAATNSLHQTLYLARRVLLPDRSQPSPYLQLQDDVLTLCSTAPLWVDVTAFESAAAQARQSPQLAAYRAALDLYTGDLLPEDLYEAWASERREALRQQYLTLLNELASVAAAHSEYAVAIETLQQVLSSDPAHEEAHQFLMRLYALTGARHQALRQYHLLRQALQQELEVEPDARSQHLYQDILAGRFGAEQQEHADAEQHKSGAKMTSPPRTPDSPASRHNLPIPLTSFVGREREIAEVKHFLATTRLLTLAGPGGCGKTRLALEVATDALPMYPDGVWLVELATLSDPALVPQAVATTLGVREAAGQPLVETLVTYLNPKHLFLVLDNCEHLVAACAPFAVTLLRSCPNLRILATSREPLHVPGEVTWLVPSLSLPDPHHLPPLDDLLGFEAMRLFVDRAVAVLPAFTITERNAPALAQICTRLEGMPLALELAAARVRVLTVEQLAERLHDCFHVLAGGNRTALTRQQTLRGTLDWSYDLLSEAERVLFHRLAVFAGSWTLEAAEAICPGPGLEASEVFGVLTGLVDKSLVVAHVEGKQHRYRVLETVRQYSAEKLRASGEETISRDRHLHWYVTLAEQAEPELIGPQQTIWLVRLETEHGNLRAALEWSKQAGDVETELRLARALFWFWYLGSYLSEGRSWFEHGLAQTDPSQRTRTRATGLLGLGQMALYQGDFSTARLLVEESVPIYRDLGERRHLAMALFVLAVVAINQGDEPAALPLLEECRVLFHELGEKWLSAMALMHLGDVALSQGEYATARARYEAGLAIQRAGGSTWGIAQLLNNLGEVARCEDDYGRAAPLYEESLALFKELGAKGDVARSLHNLGYVASAQGANNRAKALFAESLALFQERGSQRGIAECLTGLASLALAQERSATGAHRAARLLGAVEAHFEAIGAAMWPADRRAYNRNITAIQGILDEEGFAVAWGEGRALALDQAVAEARPIIGQT